MWDPAQYQRFDAERSRAFFDLLAQVTIDPRSVVDLGCGPGNLTATLSDRWPACSVLGLDSSPEMIAEAATRAIEGRVRFELGDLTTFEPAEPVDLIVSNAVLHWIPSHRTLLGRLASFLSADGVLAFQVPGNFDEPLHRILRELRTSDAWNARVGAGADRRGSADEPDAYLRALVEADLRPNVWETTYLQLLSGTDPVLEWMKGTALRPVLAELNEPEAEAFCADLAPLLRRAYPSSELGTVLPFRRVFAVGRRRSSDGAGR